MDKMPFANADLPPTPPASQLALQFSRPNDKKPFAGDISAIVRVGRTIFAACDEKASVERLVASQNGDAYADHLTHVVGVLFGLAPTASPEIDIEGLAIDDGWLWITASHSLARKEPKKKNGLTAFAGAGDWNPRRGFIGCVPLQDEGDGVWTLPVPGTAKAAKARRLPLDSPDGGVIRDVLSRDPAIAPHVAFPSKENGLDIEGIAVRGRRLLLGLRWPVIGGHAFILDLKVRRGDTWLEIEKEYRLYAVNCGGLGIRDLAFDGDRLLVLTGAAQKLESIQRILEIDPLPKKSGIVETDNVRCVLTLPVRAWGDHAESMTLLDGNRVVVAHDSPAVDRFDEDADRLIVDVFDLRI
ncbi:MAG: DUF3616 domain-containing protein [Phyllobacteriaceae bacterium]|nr:DUF3616 domain-containing protein [Phyllobacteriaceae bacterium]